MTSKATFTVTVSALPAGHAIGICIGEGTTVDPAKCVPLTYVGPAVSGVGSGLWRTSKALVLPQRPTHAYKYAVLTAAGAFVSWEKLPVDVRTLTTGSAKAVNCDDAFGELADDAVQRHIEENAETMHNDATARTTAVTKNLQSHFGGEHTLQIVTYSLPVVLHKDEDTGKWSGSWIDDDVLARTPQSIADSIRTVWVGCVTYDCIDTRTQQLKKRRGSTDATGAGGLRTATSALSLPQSALSANGDAASLSLSSVGGAAGVVGGSTQGTPQPGFGTNVRNASFCGGFSGTGTATAGRMTSSDSAAQLAAAATPSAWSSSRAAFCSAPGAAGSGAAGAPTGGGGAGTSALPAASPGAFHTSSTGSGHEAGAAAATGSGSAAPSISSGIIDAPSAGGIDIAALAEAAAAGVDTGISIVLKAPSGTGALVAMTMEPEEASDPAAPLPDASAAAAFTAAAGAAMIPIEAEEAASALSITLDQGDILAITALLNEMGAVPIFLPSALHDAYACYCMSVLKPCMHNVLETGSQRLFPYASSLAYLSQGWKHYCAANELIASVLYSLYTGPGDVIWTNDYALMLVPRILVRMCGEGGAAPAAPAGAATAAAVATDAAASTADGATTTGDAGTGKPSRTVVSTRPGRTTRAGGPMPPHRPAQVFFLHAPFPTSEIFRTLSVRDNLLAAMLECDVIGFHSFNYGRHFLQCVKRLLGYPFSSRRGGALAVDVNGRDVFISITHVGVEASALNEWMASTTAAAVARHFAEKYAGRTVIAGFDSCQRLSGIALKLLSYERLLEENPAFRDRLVLVQRCEMRGGITADMRRTSAEIRERVGRIQAVYGRAAIDYEESHSYPPTYRVGLFHAADVLLQTPIREGMNSVPLEYVYVRTQWQMQRSKAYAQQLQLEDALQTPVDGSGVVAAGAAAGGAAGDASERGADGSDAIGVGGIPTPSPGVAPADGGTGSHRHAVTVPQLAIRSPDHGAKATGGTSTPLDAAAGRPPLTLRPISDAVLASGNRSVGPLSSPPMTNTTTGDDGGTPSGSDAEATGVMCTPAMLGVAGDVGASGGVGGDGGMISLPDAAIKAMTTGMPEYYATLSAPPGRASLGRAGGGSVGSAGSGGKSAGRAATLTTTSTGGSGKMPLSAIFPRVAAAAAAAATGTGSSTSGGPGSPLSSSSRAAEAGGVAAAAPTGRSLLGGSSLTASAATATADGAATASSAGAPAPITLGRAPSSGGGSHHVSPRVPPTIIGTGASTPTTPMHRAIAASALGTPLLTALSASAHGAASASAAAGGGAAASSSSSTATAYSALLTAPLPPPPRGGCILLSEFSTASHILNSNLVVNPWSISLTTREIEKALAMPDYERSFRQWRDYQYAIRNPAGSWSRQVIADTIESYMLARGRPGATAAAAAATATPVRAAAAAPAAAVAAVDAVVEATASAGGSAPAAVDATAIAVAALAAPLAPIHGCPHLPVAALVAAYKAAKRRFFVVDYGGTMMVREPVDVRGPSHNRDFAIDGYSKHIPVEVENALEALSTQPRNKLYVVSGLRTTAIEGLHLARLQHLGLAAENGMLVSHPTPLAATDGGVATAAAPDAPSASSSTATTGATLVRARSDSASGAIVSPRSWVSLTPSDPEKAAEWARVRSRAEELMHDYQWRVNGSVTRVYDSLVAWDFKNTDAEWGQVQAKFLAEDLEALASDAVKVSLRKSRVEVALRAMNKGRFVREILDAASSTDAGATASSASAAFAAPDAPDFVFIAGDDVTDEEMFNAMNGWVDTDPSARTHGAAEGASAGKCSVFTVLVGRPEKRTRAHYYVADVASMQALLVALSKC